MEKKLTSIYLTKDKKYSGFIVNNDYRFYGMIYPEDGSDDTLYLYGKYRDGKWLELLVDGKRYLQAKTNALYNYEGNVYQEYINPFNEDKKVFTLPVKTDDYIISMIDNGFLEKLATDEEFNKKYESFFGTLPIELEKQHVISDLNMREF